MRGKVAKVCVTQHDNKTGFRVGLFYSFYIHLMQRVFKYDDSYFFSRKSEEESQQKKFRLFLCVCVISTSKLVLISKKGIFSGA